MKLKKIFFALFIALLLVFALAACSSSHEHSFSEWETVSSPTCTAFGLQKRACECGQIEYDTKETVAHTPIIDEGVDATCTTPGKTEGSHCSACGFVIKTQTETPKLSHSFSEWETVAETTCTAFGLQKRTCACGQVEYNTENAFVHTPVIDEGVSATCTAFGKTEGSHCASCGAVITAQTEIPKLSHSFSEWETVSVPTCTSIGLQKRSCECGQAEYDTINALSHNVVTDAAIAATCTTPGKTEGSHCGTCGTVLAVQNTILPLGHNCDEITVLEEALCNLDGTKRHSCSRASCDYYYDESYSLTVLDSSEIYSNAVQYTGVIKTFGHFGESLLEAPAFVISADGVIVTSNYKIDNAFSAVFILGEREYEVTEVLAFSKEVNLAVLKIEATDLPYANLCEREPVGGETIYSVGAPGGVSDSMSRGIVSHANREFSGIKYIQHDANMNAGYCGGPLVNRYGEVIGINVGFINEENISLAVSIAELASLDYSTPMTFEEYGNVTFTPIEYINEWVLNYSNVNGSDSLAYAIYGDTFCYALGYDLVQNVSFVEGIWITEDGYELRVRVYLDNSDGTYQYCGTFVGGGMSNETYGFIDAATYTAETILEYDTYYGKYFAESELMARYSKGAYDVLGFLSYCFDTYFNDITLETFGFTNISYERDGEALAMLQSFIMTYGEYESLTGSYVLSGGSQAGENTMQFNIAYHIETSNVVVSVHYYLTNGDIYSAYLTLNPTEDGNRFDFMCANNGADGYKIYNQAWGYLDAGSLTNQTKLTCYEFNGMNEYEDMLLNDYSMFLNYIMGLINYNVMPAVDPALTVKDLGFYFYFG